MIQFDVIPIDVLTTQSCFYKVICTIQISCLSILTYTRETTIVIILHYRSTTMHQIKQDEFEK